MDAKPTVLAIAPEGDWEYLAPLRSLSGLSVLISSRLQQEQVKQSELVVLSASSCSIVSQWLLQIRQQPALSLLPVLAVTPQNGSDSYRLLADEVIHIPLSLAQLEPKLDYLLKLRQQVNAFLPISGQLTPHEGQLTNLLRYLVSRKIDSLVPSRLIDSRLGYAYPLAAAFLNTSFGEESAQLQELEQLGLLKGIGYDRLHLCPGCERYQLNFREVCPKCQLPHIDQEGNIHHYSCSYIAPESEFLAAQQLICPKCRKPLRHIGVDYDKPSLSYKCRRCRHLFPEPVVSCLCINCGNIFPPERAHLAEIKEYRITMAGVQAAQSGVIQEIPKRVAVASSPEVLSYSMFEEMFSIQLWISKRLHRPFCLIGIKLDNALLSSQGIADFGNLLRQSLRYTDLITVIGEEQFLILMSETDSQKAGLAIKRVIDKITCKIDGKLQFRIGIAQIPGEDDNLEQLVAKLLEG